MIERDFIIDCARGYLVDVGYTYLDIDMMADDYVLERVNMLFFGGIQSFVRKVKSGELQTHHMDRNIIVV